MYSATTQELDDPYKINFWGKVEEDWPTFHKKYFEMWEHRYDYLPMHEPFLTLELAKSPDYMDLFRQHCRRRPR
ncbi:hypothetical protein Goari_011414 [Gossypium aridum]|uniref:Uncharacterized protein n=1 Tax=Gossypium aridum TaxID=34290 RepID=A0A7J8WX73_GOSAI|nr:hypothetical protein [Gossypium aridum]